MAGSVTPNKAEIKAGIANCLTFSSFVRKKILSNAPACAKQIAIEATRMTPGPFCNSKIASGTNPQWRPNITSTCHKAPRIIP